MRRLIGSRASAPRHCQLGLVAGTAVAIGAATRRTRFRSSFAVEVLYVGDGELHVVDGFAVFLVVVVLDAATDGNRRAFAQILGGVFGLRTPQGPANTGDAFDWIIVFVLDLLVGDDQHGRAWSALRADVAHFRGGGQIADLIDTDFGERHGVSFH